MRSFRVIVVACLLVLPVLLSAQSPPADIVPGDNLVIDGIPSIPAAIAATTNRYTEFRTASLQDWHPTERSLLITTRFGDTNQVHQVKFPGGDRSQLTFFPDRVLAASYQPTKGDYFSSSRTWAAASGSRSIATISRPATSTLLTDGKSRNLGVQWNHAGDRIAYSSTRRNGKDTDIWVMDPRDPKSDHLLLQLEGGGWAVSGWSFDDKQFALMEQVSINESYVWLVNAATGEKTLITPKGGAEKVAYSWRRIQQGRQRALRHHRQRLRVQAPDLP